MVVQDETCRAVRFVRLNKVRVQSWTFSNWWNMKKSKVAQLKMKLSRPLSGRKSYFGLGEYGGTLFIVIIFVAIIVISRMF